MWISLNRFNVLIKIILDIVCSEKFKQIDILEFFLKQNVKVLRWPEWIPRETKMEGINTLDIYSRKGTLENDLSIPQDKFLSNIIP